ncbi:hypothetical protein BV25DRAFT_1860190 [Artomyces pyxidatus]|uniref:Uncharacterized protein n=1 Tax=Artomyces pyxidatus TaxID=48021 RepID=A0ACB8SSV9_9AGAM|nr:hypothetical protein BV25DRAFT_1860190 [Artomyces pyxidatus]
MSDKAKGKRRAVDIAPEPQPSSRQLMVRFTEGIPDLILPVGDRESVRDVKANIRKARPQLQNRRLKLIHSGRLLTDGTFLYSWLKSLEERQRRAHAKDSLSPEADEAETPPTAAAPPWLHCSVGPEFAEGEEEKEVRQQTAQLKPLRGFDRLAAAGFTESDISNFRRQFHSQSSDDFISTEEFENDEEYEEHARALEEQWIDSIDTNHGAVSLSRTDPGGSDVLQGIIIGFFFPLLPFFYFKDAKAPVFWENDTAFEPLGSIVFSRKKQMGLVVGFLANFLFGLWRYLWEDTLSLSYRISWQDTLIRALGNV